MLSAPDEGAADSRTTTRPAQPGREPLRLMAVHAHPDDESSKGAATMARYVREGVEVLVCTLTGGERGDILNPAMERPEIRADLTAVRRAEMAAAREILGVQQRFLGFTDSGLPEGDPLPPLPDGCFALEPLESAAGPLVQAVREFRPHVILTYDENGGYPHPDHIKSHQVSVEAFEAAADPDRYPDCGEPWQPLKLYYHLTFHRDRMMAMHEEMLRAGWSRRTPNGSPNGSRRRTAPAVTCDHDQGAVRRLLRDPQSGTDRPRHSGRSPGWLVRCPGGGPAHCLAD